MPASIYFIIFLAIVRSSCHILDDNPDQSVLNNNQCSKCRSEFVNCINNKNDYSNWCDCLHKLWLCPTTYRCTTYKSATLSICESLRCPFCYTKYDIISCTNDFTNCKNSSNNDDDFFEICISRLGICLKK